MKEQKLHGKSGYILVLKGRFGFYSHRFIPFSRWNVVNKQRKYTRHVQNTEKSHVAYSTLFPEALQRHSQVEEFQLREKMVNIRPRDINLGVSIELKLEAEIVKIAYLCKAQERKVEE